MLCANYYTSVIKNLLPPTACPPPLLSFFCVQTRESKERNSGGHVAAGVCHLCLLWSCREVLGAGCSTGGISGQGTQQQHPAACLFLVLVCEAGLSPLMALLAFSARLIFVLTGRILVELLSLFPFIFKCCSCSSDCGNVWEYQFGGE